MPKKKAAVSSSDSDSGPDEDPVPPKKKQKPEEKRKSKSASGSNEAEEKKFMLSKNRFATVREFRGRVMVDIREFYTDSEGDLKPGKKGISLSTDQWAKLKDRIDDIDEAVKDMS